MMTEMMKKPFLRAEDVAEILSISKPYAYKIIRELNEELKAKGYRTITGRINTRFFFEKTYYGMNEGM